MEGTPLSTDDGIPPCTERGRKPLPSCAALQGPAEQRFPEGRSLLPRHLHQSPQAVSAATPTSGTPTSRRLGLCCPLRAEELLCPIRAPAAVCACHAGVAQDTPSSSLPVLACATRLHSGARLPRQGAIHSVASPWQSRSATEADALPRLAPVSALAWPPLLSVLSHLGGNQFTGAISSGLAKGLGSTFLYL